MLDNNPGRFWRKRGNEVSMNDEGFFIDPVEKYGKILNPNAQSYKEISATQCLILLGEPGTGKTTEINKMYECSEGEKMIIDFKEINSDYVLDNELFKSEEIERWKKDSTILHLFLDSFDEGRIRLDTLAAIMSSKLKKLPTERLMLRIACRTSDFPDTFSKELDGIFLSKDKVGLYEICPLRKIDVVNFVSSEGVRGDQFVQQIIQKGLQAFAGTPVTLKFLLKIFSDTGNFAENKLEIYKNGCEELSKEPNEKRQESKNEKIKGKLSVEERMLIIGRIAMLTTFANKIAIYKGDKLEIQETDLHLNDIIGKTEIAHDIEFSITNESVEEALGTSFFTSFGKKRMRWAHQTYQEYMTAWYLNKNNVPLSKLKLLFFETQEGHEKILPQLYENAAWMSLFPIDFENLLYQKNPEIFLRTEVATFSDDKKEKIIGSLLTNIEKGDLIVDRWLMEKFTFLIHKKIAIQLIPYIQDKNKNIHARNTAIDIIERCNCTEVQEILLKVVLDDAESLSIRDEAIHALAKIGNEKTLKELIIFAEGIKEDKEDQLKGAALKALYPRYISTQDVFHYLTSRKRTNFMGSYYSFIQHYLPQNIPVKDLSIALSWVENYCKKKRYDSHTTFGKLTEEILKEGWKNHEEIKLARPIAGVLLAILKKYGDVKNILDWELDPDFRRLVIKEIIKINTDKKFVWYFQHGGLLSLDDLDFYINEYKKNRGGMRKEKWAEIILYLFHGAKWDYIYSSLQNDLFFMNLLQPYLSTQLNSDRARHLRSYYYSNKKQEEKQEKLQQEKEKFYRDFEKNIVKYIKKFNDGKMEAWWWDINRILINNEKDNTLYCRLNVDIDLSKSKQWGLISEMTKGKIFIVAQEYLYKYQFSEDFISNVSIVDYPSWAGYRALRLLFKDQKQQFDLLDISLWKKWMPAIVSAIIHGDSEDLDNKIISIAYEKSPDDFMSEFEKYLSEEKKVKNSYLSSLQLLKNLNDKRVGDFLLDSLKDRKLGPDSIEGLLQKLLQIEDKNILQKATQRSMTLLKRKNIEVVKKTLKLILQNIDHFKWEEVWKFICNNPELAESVLQSTFSMGEKGEAINLLTTNQLSELYIWLTLRNPKEDDFLSNSHGFSIAYIRGRVLEAIKFKGNLEACKKIKEIADRFPEKEWIRSFVLVQAKELSLQKQWQPLSPKEILALVKDRDVCLIRNEQDLANMVLNALEKFQKEYLQSQTPMAKLLWFEDKPRPEGDLSDTIKDFLDRELRSKKTVVNREVEVERRERGNGDQPDILVSYIDNNNSLLTIPIEVKGNWNRQLFTQMERQLFKKYMKNKSSAGIYITGWYHSRLWNDSRDYRKRDANKNGHFEEIQERLQVQANDLSNENGVYIKSVVLDIPLTS